MKSYKVIAKTLNSIIVKGVFYDAHRCVTLYLSQGELSAYKNSLEIMSCDELNNNVQEKSIDGEVALSEKPKNRTTKKVGPKNVGVENKNREENNQ